MRIYDPDYTSAAHTERLPFKWGAAGDTHVVFTNWSQKPVYVHECVIQNGATAGSATAGAFDVKTPNSEYVFTFPSATMVAKAVAKTQFIGAERVAYGQSFLVTQKTATTGAIDGEIILLIQD